MARKPSTINPNETKSERFKRIGEPRINATLDSIRKLANLGASQYEYSEEQVATIILSIQDATRDLNITLYKRFEKKRNRVTL